MAEKEKKGFVLADVLDGVSKSGTEGRKQIEYIDIDLIYPDPKNREIKNIQEMADSIAMNGLSAPLDLRLHPEIEGAYMVVSGHRRRAGLLLLVEEDPEKWRKVPCIVDCAQRSEAEWRMKNLDANMQTQELTDAERAAHAAEVTDLIYRLKEEGHEFPGRVRDWLAEKCKISASKLARLKVIQDKLVAPKFVAMWKAGELKEDPAYVLAQMPAMLQAAIATAYTGEGTPTGWRLEAVRKQGENHYLTAKAKCPDGAGCTNCNGFLAHDLDDRHYSGSGHCKCCVTCYDVTSCKYACPAGKEEAKKRRAKTRAENKEIREAEAKVKKDRADFWADFAARLALVCNGDRGVYDAALQKLDKKTIERCDVSMRYTLPDMAFKAGYKVCVYPEFPADVLAALCRQLGVSADYLLGLTDEKEVADHA